MSPSQEDPDGQDCKAQQSSFIEELIDEDVEDARPAEYSNEGNGWPDENAEDAPIVYVVNSLG